MLPPPVTANGKTRMSLMEKWQRSWKGEEIDPRITKMSDHMATFCFFFIAITELYVILEFVIPYRYREWDEMNQYYLKVFACYVFVQSMANWLCVRCYQSAYKVSADRPDSSNDTTWEGFSNGKMSPRGEGDYFASSSANLSLHWHHCYACNMKVPPRAHHCKICKRCILRRDHHCYMSGVCIGHHNQRYFIVMNFYIMIASLYGLYEIIGYLGDHFYPTASTSDFFLPKTIYVWFVYDDVIPTEIMLMVVHCYFLWWTGFTALGFVLMQILAVYQGLTSHESQHNVPVRSVGTTSENFREVFGVLWGFNFFWPSQILFRQSLDGTHWPNLKPDRAKLIRKLREKVQGGLYVSNSRRDA